MGESSVIAQRGTPTTVRWAALALVAYAVVILVSATVLQAINDWEAAGEYPRAVIRVLGVALVVWGLLRRARWAWWLGVALPLLWIVSGIAALAMFLSVRTDEADAVLPPAFYPLLSVTMTLLTVALVLLVLPGSRAAFRSIAA
jgi:hypothetical protein